MSTDIKIITKKITALFISLLMCALCACNVQFNMQGKDANGNINAPEADSIIADGEEPGEPYEPQDINGEIYIIFTSDVHCGIDQGFGYAGLAMIRDELEKKGYTTLLVDNGDSVQGEAIGTLTKGDAIIDLMNDLHYDIATPGNHDFDYGMEKFLELTKKADFPYICCNFNKEGKLIFEPYIVKEVCGHKIGFVGVTTPETLTTSTPDYFKNDKGEFVYGFMQDSDGSGVYKAVQSAVDAARADGAELVYVMGHMGLESNCVPWTYADVIANTTGIDVFLDGHSHDTEQLVAKNKDGKDVPRSAVGYKLNAIGYSHISAEGEILETGIWSWPNKTSMADLLSIDNDISKKVDAVDDELSDILEEVVAHSDYDLTVNDPKRVDDAGDPVRMIRFAETNIGDFVADAYRDQGDADIGRVNGGGIRTGIDKGDITYKDIIDVQPFGNMLCVVEVTGQTILDALEWGSHVAPDENGGFLQVSGLTYEIDTNIKSGCIVDENTMFAGIKGERRVSNVMVGDKPIDPKKTYTLAGHSYMLKQNGDGYTMFDDAKFVEDSIKLDNQVIIDYITETLGGTVGQEYANPYGQGRIVVK